jgi:hypothetical protein
MTEVLEKKNELASQPFQEMDVRDEGQILAEMRGEFLEQYVYSFTQAGKAITNLSYVGVKEAIRRRGHVQILDHKVEEVNGKYRATVLVHDIVNDIDVLGVSEAEVSKPFAYVLAVNKAERNAFMKIIPAKFYAELIKEKLQPSRVQPVNVTPHKPVSNQPKQEQIEEELIQANLLESLTLTKEEDNITIKNKTLLEKDVFKTVCGIAERFGGKWVKEEGVWVIPV